MLAAGCQSIHFTDGGCWMRSVDVDLSQGLCDGVDHQACVRIHGHILPGNTLDDNLDTGLWTLYCPIPAPLTGKPGLMPPRPIAGVGGGTAERGIREKSSYTRSCRPATLPGRGARLSGREAGNLGVGSQCRCVREREREGTGRKQQQWVRSAVQTPEWVG